MFFFFLSKGDLYYIDKIMSVYNYSGKGIFSGSDKILKKVLGWNMLLLANKELKYKYNALFARRLKNKMKFGFITYLKLVYFTKKENLTRAYNHLYDVYLVKIAAGNSLSSSFLDDFKRGMQK